MFLHRPLLLSFLQRMVGNTTWRVLLATYFIHYLFTWAMLAAFSEPLTQNFIDYTYWYSVSMSTVGFGDISPVTPGGRLFYALIIAPTGILLFGSALAKLGELYLTLKKRFVAGTIDVSDLSRHIIVFGWIPQRTAKLTKLLQANKKKIVIVSDEKGLDHPLINTDILYVNVENYVSVKELKRLGLEKCDSIIVNTGIDAVNYLTAVAVDHYLERVGSNAHIVVYSECEDIQALLEGASGRTEIINIHDEHLLSRSAMFPGSSSCTEALLNPAFLATHFTLKLPIQMREMAFSELSAILKRELKVISIGFSKKSDKLGRNLQLNPDDDAMVSGGDFIHYIANQEIQKIETHLKNYLC
ncbi:NAD-binding protein [Vibrio alginolyticus]|uniref:potassium channel protein n=1 Tax=Vibrio alginolyticus TaxID=663 RepID=UPI001BD63D03|nr:potassium channel family protein [Vibrio alginolyticus]MBS9879777.1 NAD-binding protein [Vibrio alginolyticus]